MYPRVLIDLSKISHNTRYITDLCRKQGIKVAAVTKVVCGNFEIAEAMVKNGAHSIADSRLENLKKLGELNLEGVKIEKWLLRLPMIAEAEEVVLFSDVSLNSELSTITAINYFSSKHKKTHKLILMIEMGDLREGYFTLGELFLDIEKIVKMENVVIYGLGVNLTCYGAIIPEVEQMKELLDIAGRIEKMLGIKLEILSGGNSSSLPLVLDRKMPEGINHLRLGDSIIMGRETAYCKEIPNMYGDAMILEVQIIELKDKPSQPMGNSGVDVFGQKPVFVNRGIRRKAIVAIGKQDVEIDDLTPLVEGIEILGASSDHLILDVTDSKEELSVGGTIRFRMGYTATLRAMTSEYVRKVIHS